MPMRNEQVQKETISLSFSRRYAWRLGMKKEEGHD
jgi:hypothetical protein